MRSASDEPLAAPLVYTMAMNLANTEYTRSVVRRRDVSDYEEWHAPIPWLEAARDSLGGIDLDVASSEEANQFVRAKHYFTKPDDGLRQDWTKYGSNTSVWCFPPVEPKNELLWTLKCIRHTGPTCMLTRAWGFEYFDLLLRYSDWICWMRTCRPREKALWWGRPGNKRHHHGPILFTTAVIVGFRCIPGPTLPDLGVLR